jgi:hypothetical protein
MSHHNLDFVNRTEQYRREIAFAQQQRMIKEAQRAGMVLPPLVPVRPLAMALARLLTRFASLLAAWSCSLQARYAPVTPSAPLESQSSPCS